MLMVYSYFITSLFIIPLLIFISALLSVLVIALKFVDNNHDGEHFIDVISKVKGDFKGYVLSFNKQFLFFSWKISRFLLLLFLVISIILIALQLVFLVFHF